jgi:sugar phosphate isomerase/epimerase
MQALIRIRWAIFFLCKVSFILVAYSILGSQAATVEAEHPTGTVHPFPIFDGLLYLGKPDLRPLGLVPIAWIGALWRPGVSTETVDEVQVRTEFERLRNSSGFYYLDIENWPLLSVSVATRQQNIEKLARVIDLARRTAPNAHLGFYGLLPGITYWPLFRHDAEYREWLEVNRALDPLAGHVDAVFPSLYTYYDDLEGWKNYARQTLTEARRYGKPVYVFLWPQFHDSNPTLRGQEVPRAFWLAELELCAELADGIVLWGGWQGHWDENAAWWQETLTFMKTLKDVSPSADRASSRITTNE